MTVLQMIARPFMILMAFGATAWGFIEGLSQAVGLVGGLPVAFVLTIVATAIVTYALTRRFVVPPVPPTPPPTP